MNRKIIMILSILGLFLIFLSTTAASTSLTYEYDANGNLISGDGKYYEYNDANQLIKVRHGDQNGPVIAEYVYDYTGQRIKKIENGVTTYYIGKHFEKQVDSAGAATTTDYYIANGERVAKKDSLGNIYYYHLDHLGGTNVVTDSSGNLVERIKYYPFGEIREGGTEKYSFTGKEKDNLTDFYYFEARYYNHEFKHFTQADSIEPDYYDPQDLNRYVYVRNNPMKLIDPSGHSSIFADLWEGIKQKYSAAKNWLSGRATSLTTKATNILNKNIFDYGNNTVEKVMSTSIDVYSRTNNDDKKIVKSSIENIPGGVGTVINTGNYFYGITNYMHQGDIYKWSNGALGTPYTFSGTYKTFFEDAPLGIGFGFKAGRFFLEENLYNFSGGKSGKQHSLMEMNEILTSTPWGIGYTIEASEYLLTEGIYNKFYK